MRGHSSYLYFYHRKGLAYMVFCLRDINTDSVLIGLKPTNQLFARVEILVRSELSIRCSRGFSNIIEAIIICEQANIRDSFSDFFININ